MLLWRSHQSTPPKLKLSSQGARGKRSKTTTQTMYVSFDPSTVWGECAQDEPMWNEWMYWNHNTFARMSFSVPPKREDMWNRNDVQICAVGFKQRSNPAVVLDPRGELAVWRWSQNYSSNFDWIFFAFCFAAARIFLASWSLRPGTVWPTGWLCVCVWSTTTTVGCGLWLKSGRSLCWSCATVGRTIIWSLGEYQHMFKSNTTLSWFWSGNFKKQDSNLLYVFFIFFFRRQLLAWLLDLPISAVVSCIRSSR